jgi:hypothetical protein
MTPLLPFWFSNKNNKIAFSCHADMYVNENKEIKMFKYKICGDNH